MLRLVTTFCNTVPSLIVTALILTINSGIIKLIKRNKFFFWNHIYTSTPYNHSRNLSIPIRFYNLHISFYVIPQHFHAPPIQVQLAVLL